MQDDFVRNERKLLLFLQENYNLVTLSIETNYKKISENCEKRLDYIDFLRSETLSFFSRIVSSISDEEESKTLLKIIDRYDYLFQIHDSIKDLFHTKKTMEEHYIELNSDLLMFIRDISNRSMSLFSSVHDSLDKKTAKYSRVKKDAHDLQTVLDEVNKGLLALIANPERRDAGALTHLVTYSQRLKDKLVNFSSIKSNPLKKGLTSRDQDIAKEPIQIKKTTPP